MEIQGAQLKLEGNNKAVACVQSEHTTKVVSHAPFLNAHQRVSTLENIGLMVIPICFLFLASIFLHAKGPYWLGTSSDPDYPYLFNALLIDQGQPPEHIDHPGTPVQLWVAGVLKMTHFAVGRGSLVDDVLARPEFYLKVANWTFLAALAAALWGAGHAIWRITRSRWAAILMQATPLLCPTIFYEVECVKPEPLLAICIVLFITTAMLALRPQSSKRLWPALLFGILCGITVAVKVTALPMLLFALVLLPSWRDRLLWTLIFLVTLAIVILPILSHLPQHAKFLWRITTHQQAYGLGEAGIDWRWNFREFWTILCRQPFLQVTMALNLVVLAAAWIRRRSANQRFPKIARLLSAILLTQFAVLAQVFRHPYAERYLLPALMLAGMSAALCFLFLTPTIRRWPPLLQKISHVAIAAALSIYLAISLTHLHQNLTAQRKAQLDLVRTVQNYPGHPQVLTCYHSSSLLYSLYFGNSWARFSFSSTLEKLYPNSLFDNNWAKRFENFGGDPQPLTVETALLQGMAYTSNTVYPAGFRVALVKSIGFENIYLLTKSGAEPPK